MNTIRMREISLFLCVDLLKPQLSKTRIANFEDSIRKEAKEMKIEYLELLRFYKAIGNDNYKKSFTRNRAEEIAMAINRRSMQNRGFPLGDAARKGAIDVSKRMGIPANEFFEFVKKLSQELTDETYRPL